MKSSTKKENFASTTKFRHMSAARVPVLGLDSDFYPLFILVFVWAPLDPCIFFLGRKEWPSAGPGRISR